MLIRKLAWTLPIVLIAGWAAWVWNDSPPAATLATDPRTASYPPQDEEDEELVRVEPTLSPGKPFPETIKLYDGGESTTLHFTGSFIRKRVILFINLDIYEIGSYVEKPRQENTETLLADLLTEGTRKVYYLRFLRRLSAKQIRHAYQEEINLTFGDVDLEKQGASLDRFMAQFDNGSQTGDAVYLAWLPGGRTYSSYGNPHRLNPIGEDIALARAIWRIWAGDNAGPERLGLVQRYAVQTATR